MSPPQLKKMIGGVWRRFTLGDIVMGRRASLPRKKKVSDEQALLASHLFLKGANGMGGWYPFPNAKEVRTSSPLAAACGFGFFCIFFMVLCLQSPNRSIVCYMFTGLQNA